MELPVIIVGAGFSGLALAQGLKRKGIPCIVFERDVSRDVRNQGVLIGVNEHGIYALQELVGKEEANRMLCRSSVSVDKRDSTDPQHSIFKMVNPKSGSVMLTNDRLCTADRTILRIHLLEGIDVRWGKQFLSYQENESSVTVKFVDGTTVEGRIIVGADGRFSKVRKQRLPEIDHVTFDKRILALPFCIEQDLCDRLFQSAQFLLFPGGR
jgi:2-polyprenyl-6-methoxyphenol hydroxylase-like FAD-dependent oxidoreductase